MTLFTDELVIWGRSVCYCVGVAHPQQQQHTHFQPSAADFQQAVSHAL